MTSSLQDMPPGEKTRKPKRFMVVFLTDDATPIDFVARLLKKFFGLDRATANCLAIEICENGTGKIGPYTREIAETRALMATDAARRHDHALRCDIMEA